MSDLATMDAKLSDLDLAALLCSRVCHDVISPVGAIANGLELIDDPEMDDETKETALAMVRSSAKTAAAKLKFCRIAFGAAGSAGALIDMGEAGEIAKAFVGDEKAKLEWNAPRENRPKQQVKLVLNMITTGAMVLLGKTFGNRMIDLQPTNEKLRIRTRRILRELTGVDDAEARVLLDATAGRLKPALVMALAGVDATQAMSLLDAHDGQVGAAVRTSKGDERS